MYSYEDRIRAVKLYIKLGKRLGATIRQLGYPTKNSLIGWHREYERSRDLRVGYSRSGKKYSDQHKQAAVQHYLDHDRCIASTMRALGYPCRALLTEWIDELHPEVRYRMVGRAPNILHTEALKNAAVIELCTRKTSAQEIAQKLAVCRPTLYNWKNQLLGREAPASMKRQNDLPPVPDTAELQRQPTPSNARYRATPEDGLFRAPRLTLAAKEREDIQRVNHERRRLTCALEGLK